jgi:hypothetical protein
MVRRSLVIVVLILGGWSAQAQLALPTRADSLKFAVIGDNGTGGSGQADVGRQMNAERAAFPFEFVLMLGDNMYGSQAPKDFVTKFEQPYAALLHAGVRFHAAIGNHDSAATLTYEGFNMAGRRYYTYTRGDVQFFVLDTNLLDKVQLTWIDEILSRSTAPWKIAYFHHPLYSNGDRHGSNVELRVALEPLLVKFGIAVVFSGHDHTYERIKPQQGITYFVEGASGQLRKGGLTPSSTTAASFDQDQTFMLVEIAGDELFFRTISRTGRTVDSGTIRRPTS